MDHIQRTETLTCAGGAGLDSFDRVSGISEAQNSIILTIKIAVPLVPNTGNRNCTPVTEPRSAIR